MKVLFKKFSKAQKAFAAGITTVAVVAAAVIGLGASSVQASSCPSNDIMPCGASSKSNFISKLKANKPSDMNNIYADSRYDLPKSQYDEFAKYAKSGRINPDNGNITVDGKTVGYNGLSLGRNSKGSISTAVKIDGKTYYQSHIKDLTKYFNDAMVLFDAKGNVQTVIMNLCGNPIKVTPNNPKYECKMLNVTPGNDNLTFNFSSSVSASNGATVTKVVYDFGDGKTETQKSPSTVVSHTYAAAGTYNAKVTAYVKTTFGRGEFPIAVTANCMKVVTAKELPKPSVTITKTVDGVDRKEVALNTPFVYQLVVKNTGNVELKDALVSDSAPANVTFVSTDRGVITHNTLSYTTNLAVGASETINITAKLTKYVEGDVVNKACVDTPTIPGSPDACDTTVITTPKPSVKIEKLVNGVKRDEVAVGETFTYTVKVTNDGKVDLVNAVVTDPAPAGVTLLTTDKGTISGNALNYQVSLTVGASDTITITAKVNAYKAGDIVNTACVDAVEVVNPSNPYAKDDCDDATVTVKEPGKVSVCNPATGEIIQVPEADKDKYEPVTSEKCKPVRVCNPETGTIIEVKWQDKDKYLPADSDKCQDISVCVIADGTGAMVTIKKDQYDSTKHSTNSADCKKVPVCRLSDKTKVTIKESEYNANPSAYSKTMSDCDTLPEVLPNTGAGNVIGLFFGTVVTAGLFHYFVLGRKKA